jgi:hypothetical protein
LRYVAHTLPGTEQELTEKPRIPFGPADANIEAEKSALRQAVIRYVMAALVTVTLIWGGCLSCSQYFVSPIKTAKACCDPHGGCKEKPGSPKSTRECNIQPAVLAKVKVLNAALQFSLISAALPAQPGQFITQSRRPADFRFALTDRGSPPDLTLLHCVFRI